MEKTKVIFLVNLYPYEAGQVWEIKSSLVEDFIRRDYVKLADEESKPEKKEIVKVSKSVESWENKSMEKKEKKTK